MRDKSTIGDGLTRVLWIGAALLFILTEAQVIVPYLYASTPHPSFAIGRLLVTVLLISVPGIAGLKGYSVVRGLSSAIGSDDEAKLVWLARQFLTIVIVAYVAIGWVTR